MTTPLEITTPDTKNLNSEENTVYYVKSLSNVGPNSDDHDDLVLIETRPAVTNSSHEERDHGWCGTTNDWSLTAHGAFETEAEARAAVTELFGDTRDANLSGDDAFELGVTTREDYEGALELGDPDAPAGYTFAALRRA